jgi:hypothetical protein
MLLVIRGIKMNLQAMYDYINANPKTIRLEVLPAEDYGTYLFIRVTYAVETYTCDQASVCIVIKDRGLGTEAAYVKGGFPAYLKPTTFRDELKALVTAYMVSNPTLESYSFDNVNETDNVANLTGYIYNSSTQKSAAVHYVAFKVNGVTTFRQLA